MTTADGKKLKDGDEYYHVYATNREFTQGTIKKEVYNSATGYASDWCHVRFADPVKAKEFVNAQKSINTARIENIIRHHAVDRQGKVLIEEETIKKIMKHLYQD